MRGIVACLMLVPTLSAAAYGGNAIVPAKVEVAANFNAAGVYACFEGDENANAAATMEYRAGEAKDFRPGHPLARTGKGRFAGSIFWLRPDQPLEVRVTFQDPDGVAGGAAGGGEKGTAPLSQPREKGTAPACLHTSTRTRSDKFPAGSGKTYYVSPNGDDAGGGTQEKPFKTIQHAVDLAGPGDVIDLGPGDYFQSVTVKRSGRPDAYLTLRSHRIEGEERNENGAQRRFRREGRLIGFQEVKGPWQQAEAGLSLIDEKRPVGTVTLGEQRVYHHGSLEELKTAQPPLAPGWWQDATAGKVYLRTADGKAPAPGAVRLGVLPFGLKFENCGYWIVEDVAFAVFGGGPYGRGIEIYSSRNIVVRNCRFDTMRTGISVRKAGAAECLIERCAFRDSGIWNWPWKACKSHDVEGCAISFQGGGGNVARFNHVHGTFNGIGASTWGDLENEALNRDLDIHDNVFTEIGDDPMEPEGACMNVRFWNNQTRDTLQGISLAPITVGPVYVVRDRYVNYKESAVKAGVDSRGVVYLYHVLGWTNRPDGNGQQACGPWDNMHFRNSVIRGTRYVIEDMHRHPVGCTFDFCDLFTTATDRFIKWEDQRYRNLDAVPPTAGFGRHILCVEPYGTTDADGEPTGLVPALIDAGIRIPGINDDFQGKAPDLGPKEVR